MSSSAGEIEMSAKDTAVEVSTPRSYDEEDAGDNYHDSIKGFTRNDKNDMSRMGKKQELRVRCQASDFWDEADNALEKLSSSISSCVHCHSPRVMGGPANVRYQESHS